MTKIFNKTITHRPVYENHLNIIDKKNKKTERRRSLSVGAKRDYKKSVSNSLVYRSLKLDKDGYVGFKVTYSGKGGKGNYDRSKLSIILVPDIHFIRSYRPIAGAIARSTRGEVLACAYSSKLGVNERLVSQIINRSGYAKSKLRRVDIISESQDILTVFKTRLASIERLVFDEKLTESANVEPTDLDTNFHDAASSPVARPDKVTLTLNESKPHTLSTKRRRVQLIRISRRGGENSGIAQPGVLSRMMKSVFSRLGSLFHSAKAPAPVEESKTSAFEISEKMYRVSDKINLGNPNHCDLIANDLLSPQA